MKEKIDLTSQNKFNICDVILLDHMYLKDCIMTLKNDNLDKKLKFRVAKSFLDALKKHSLAEEKTVYNPLKEIELFRKEILEGEIEHQICEEKIKYLSKKISTVRNLNDELEAEIKVLSEMTEHHVMEEEKNLLVEMRSSLDLEILNEMGMQFLRLRKFTDKDLKDYPVLKSEISTINSMSQKIPPKFNDRIKENYSSRYTR